MPLGIVAAIISVSSRISTSFVAQSRAPKTRRKMCDHLTPYRPRTRKSQRRGSFSREAVSVMQCWYMTQACGHPSAHGDHICEFWDV
eukprot:scaffold45026_cov72-Phaeocystis_antarctica.AAC.8